MRKTLVGAEGGSPGGNGQPESYVNKGNGVDAANYTNILGGLGASGAVSPTNSAIFVGAGGAGGYAFAVTDASPAVGAANGTVLANSYAGGLEAGFLVAGTGGNGTVGGAGGGAYARSNAVNSAAKGTADALAYARAGGGGFSQTSGATGGAGGVATVGPVTASGYNAKAVAEQFGGSGGGGLEYSNALGANGVNSSLVDDVSGSTTGGRLELDQQAGGGGGGFSPVAPGQAGYGKSYLSFNDKTTNPQQASALYGSSTAIGGAGGSVWANVAPVTATNGGAATASVDMVGARQVEASAKAEGGNGGFNEPGAQTAFAAGGDGGAGGAATVTGAKAFNTATSGAGYHGVAGAIGTATGGAGGAGVGAGFVGGAGGAGIVGPIYASGYSASATARQTGGAGGQGQNGANAGAGANSVLTNDVTGRTAGGANSYLDLNQYANGGGGSESQGGAAGTAGYGKSYLTFDDTSNPHQASSFNANSDAYGGVGGSAYTSPGQHGGLARATGNFYGAGAMNVSARSTGGAGGTTDQNVAGGVSAAGGSGNSLVVAHSTTTKVQNVEAGAIADGGAGGAAGPDGGSGGQGGGAIGASAKAYAAHTLNDVLAGATQTGGAGGAGEGAGFSGGAGGVATGTSAYAMGGRSVTVEATQTGGAGGAGGDGAIGGAGADSKLGGLNSDKFWTNAIGGVAGAGGYMLLEQTADGGSGGQGAAGGGQGGYGYSALTFDDTTNPTTAGQLDSRVYAGGGNSGMVVGGGASGVSADTGGGASAYQSLTGAATVIGRTSAVGGAGAKIDGGPENGGFGGNAYGGARTKSVNAGNYRVDNTIFVTGGAGGEVFNGGAGNGGNGGGAGVYGESVNTNTLRGSASVTLVETGGAGGGMVLAGPATGQNAGNGGIIEEGETAQARASGHSAYAEIEQTGGSGGAGQGGANGGAGASVRLFDGVAGTATGGTLSLKQYVTGGGGGASSGGTAGKAGNAASYLNFSETTSSALTSISRAAGGAGGAGQGTSSGATGGGAYAETSLKGAQYVNALSGAAGGQGGGVSGTGAAAAGGGASAYAYAATTGSRSASATAYVHGGAGGSVGSGATGSGGPGGAATAATAIAEGGAGASASAEARQIGGFGGAGRGAGHSGGQGGAVAKTYAKAYGKYADAFAAQTGGAGGGGYGGASGGQGANSALNDALTATAAGGSMQLTQNATGGAGGQSFGGVGGLGGFGTSSLTFSTIGDATQPDVLRGNVTGAGGAGGSGFSGGASSNGGEGDAYIYLTGVNNVSATATADGGQGGNGAVGGKAEANSTAISTTGTATATAYAGGGNATGGIQGDAVAAALAETSNGQQAQAIASVDGDASVQATASSSWTTGYVTAVSSTIAQTGSGELTLSSIVNSGNGATPLNDLGATNNAIASALPSTLAVNDLLANDPALNGLIGSVDTTATGLISGDESGVAQTGASGPQVIVSTDDFTLDTAGLSGNFIMGLIGSESYGSGFTNLDMQVSFDGASALHQDFTSVAAAKAYFNDQAVNFGSVGALPGGPLQVSVTLTVTSNAPDSGFGDAFLFATTGVNGPPVVATGPAPIIGANIQTAIPGISVSEAGNLTGVNFSVTLSDNTGQLAVNGGAIAVTGDNSNKVSFSGTLAQVNAILATLTDDNSVAGPDGIDVKVSDGANVTQTVDPVTVNSAPVWAAPAIAGYADVGTEAVKSVSLSEIGDVAPGETFTVTVSANHGQPTLGGAGVQSFDAVAITGDEAQVNAALANLTLDENSPGTDTLTLKAKDSFGNSTSEQIGVYAAGPLTLTTPPSVTLPSGGAGSTPISGASLSQTGASPTETFSVTLSDVYGDLTASATGGASVANNGSTDIVVSGALAQVNAALSSLTDNDPSGKADTIQVKATDSYGDSAGVNNIAVGVSQIYSAAQIEALTPTQIATLGTEGVTSISSSGVIRLTVPQADAFIMAAIQILPSGGMEVQVVDSGAQIETLTPTQIAGLPGLSPEFYAVISSNSGSVTLSLAQALALADGSMEVAVPFGSTLSLSDNVSDIQALKPAQIDALIGSYNGWSAIDATSGPVTIDAQQAVALEGYNAALNYYAPLSIQNATVTIADKAANIEQMTPTEISRLTQSGMSIGGLVSTDASLVFSVAQVEAIGSAFYVTVPATDTVTISDSAADIEALLNTSFVPVELAEQFAHISGIAADDASIVLTAAEAENLIQANVNLGMTVALSAPAGDSVTVQDSSADIEALTPTQLGDLSSIGVSAIHVTDLAVTLTVAQALALLDPVSIAVEPGGSVIVAGSESDIENLTPQQAAELSGLGVNEYDFQSLSGAEPLTIAVGQTLTVDGAVASGQSITFAGGDGKLALADAADMQGTVSGFQPTDAIDLTGAPYDASATATLEANNVLQVVENSGTYDIQLDPGQYFFTDNNLDTFNVAADANGQTEITLQQTPINYFEEVIPSGENADGVAVASGGVLEVQSGATLNGATVASGGDVLADNGGVANGVTLDGGELDNYGSAAGTVVGAGGLLQAYAPTTATTMQAGGTADIWGSDGGTLDVTAATGGAAVFQDAYGALQLDGTTIPDVTVDAFQPGDVIDLAGATYDSSAKPTLLAGNVLQIQELSGTYDVRLQPSQYFLSESFVVGPDNAAGTDITLQPTTLTTYAAIPTGDDVYGVTVGSGGEVDVQSQSTLAQAQVGGGGQILVESGGKDTDSILNAGSAETVLYGGEADGTGIDGGAQTIANGGYAGLVFVGNGGEQIVRGGGSVNVTEINDGGLVDYQAGSKINGYVNFLTTTGTAEFDGANIPGVGIYNFAAGDKIDLANYSGETGYTFTGGDLKVDFAGNESLTLNLENANPADTFQFSPFGGTGTQIELAAPCFCKGTLIRAERGEVAVETLKRGDLVMTTEGVAKPVSWIGRRAVRSAFADPVRSWPIRVRAGALGENVPSRDLLLSPDHALLVGDVLIQAGALVNGTSIVRETSVPPVFVYYHVEIDDHSLILAENTAAETFVDNLDRPGFDNWAEHEALYPDGNPIEEMSYPRAKARRQVPMHIRAALDARANAICGKKALAMA